MTRAERTVATLLVPLDYAALLAAAAMAYGVRYTNLATRWPTTTLLSFPEYLHRVAFIALGWIIVFAFAGCYAAGARRRWTTEFGRIVFASTAGFGLVLAVIVFSRELFASRFIVLASWPLAMVTVGLLRLVVRAVERICFLRGIGAHRIVLMGTGRSADALADALTQRPSLGYRIAYRIPTLDAAAIATITEHWQHGTIDGVIDATTPPHPDRVRQLLDLGKLHHIPVRYSADFLATHAPRITIETFAGVPLVEVHRTRLLGWGRIVKRIFDCTIASIVLILLSPALIAIAIAIRVDSRGPIFFRQQRIGEAGRPFLFLKFRSMTDGAHTQWAALRSRSDRAGIIPKIKNDPRVTHVGRFLRRWSLDELPQLFNVLTGTMSLVGPRPHLPEEVAAYAAHHRMVLAVPPGITGLAQVSGRADLDFEEEVQLDTYYVEHWSPALDLVVLIRTPFAIVRTRGAY
ncbi:sugar transferase [Candidatus Uhrbacteria bacterium]|nr:sugar transferase [Candidatus Uhrbacteria bacterium]